MARADMEKLPMTSSQAPRPRGGAPGPSEAGRAAPEPPSPIHAAHLIPYIGRAQGGPVISLASIAGGQSEAGARVNVFGARLPDDGPMMAFDPAVPALGLAAGKALGFRRCPGLGAAVRAAVGRSRGTLVIHSHSLWTDANRIADRAAREFGAPHVISICGALAGDALRHRAWKKWPARFWFQDAALRRASALHAKSEGEAADIRAYGLRGPVALIPNPIEPPPAPAEMAASAEAFRRRIGAEPGRRLALYVGRLHQVKGLVRLIEAWAGLAPETRAGWTLVLAGPDEGGHRAELERMVRAAGLEAEIIFPGELDDAAKWGAYEACEFLVMPSDFENFGMAIAEAMMAGRPVVTNTRAPWQVVVERRAGWRVEPDVPSLTRAMAEAMAAPPGELRAMGGRAREIASAFRRDVVARELIDVYRWTLGRADRPGSVRLD